MLVTGGAYHGFKGEAQVAAVLKGAQQLDAVASPIWVCPRELTQHNLRTNTSSMRTQTGTDQCITKQPCQLLPYPA